MAIFPLLFDDASDLHADMRDPSSINFNCELLSANPPGDVGIPPFTFYGHVRKPQGLRPPRGPSAEYYGQARLNIQDTYGLVITHVDPALFSQFAAGTFIHCDNPQFGQIPAGVRYRMQRCHPTDTGAALTITCAIQPEDS
jgi:hypothetical protein